MCVLKRFSQLVMCSDVKDRFILNLSPLDMIVSRNVIAIPEISAVNLIVGWKLLARFMNRSVSFLLESQTEKMLSIYGVHFISFVFL